MPSERSTTRDDVPWTALLPFLLIAFGLAWGILALFVFGPPSIPRRLGELSAHHPLFFLAVYAPAIAAFAIVLRWAGPGGLRRFLGRLRLWRCPPGGYAMILVGIPAIYAAGALVKGNLAEPLPFDTIGSALGAMGFMLILGPVEEFGWRGLALPILQRAMAPIWAGLIVGLVWGLWHLPAFYLSGTPQGAWDFTPFFIGSIAVSLILTPIFNASGGSLLLAALFHFQLNNPLWPDAQPYDTWFFVAAALLVIVLTRDAMFRRSAGVTRVIPPPAA